MKLTTKLLQASLVLAAAAGGLLTISGAAAEPVFRYCMIGTPNMAMDCTFNTLEQCQIMASAGVGFCQENPAFVVNARQFEPMRKRR